MTASATPPRGTRSFRASSPTAVAIAPLGICATSFQRRSRGLQTVTRAAKMSLGFQLEVFESSAELWPRWDDEDRRVLYLLGDERGAAHAHGICTNVTLEKPGAKRFGMSAVEADEGQGDQDAEETTSAALGRIEARLRDIRYVLVVLLGMIVIALWSKSTWRRPW